MAREMKDSGIEWIGKIPCNWVIRPLKGVTNRIIVGLATSVTQYYRDTGIPLLRNLNIKDDFLQDDDLLYLEEEWASLQTGKMINTGDILTVHTGYIGISCIVPEKYDKALTFTTLISTPNIDIIEPRFLMRYINVSRFYSPVYFNVETGAQNNLNTKEFINLEICVPCLKEQKWIVDFLDNKCSYIDSIMDKTRVSIEEYKKLKQAVITQAVTKGIRPDRQMKHSGIEWIGEVPSEWEISTIGREIQFEGGSQPPLFTFIHEPREGYVRLIQNRDYKTDDYITFVPQSSVFRFCDEKDVMIGRYGPPMFVMHRGLKGAYNVALMKAIPINIDREWMSYVLQEYTLLRYVESFSKRAAGQDGVNPKILKNYPLPLPPIEEQKSIALYLEKKTKELDDMIRNKEHLIIELQEYKRSLIYEYVTGKKEA